MKRKPLRHALSLLVSALALTTTHAQTPAEKSGAQAASAKIDRTVLPVPEPNYLPITELDARNAKAPPRFEVKAPNGAPNVVVVLLDDIGFGQSSAFGGSAASTAFLSAALRSKTDSIRKHGRKLPLSSARILKLAER